jgi:hypothetical protein
MSTEKSRRREQKILQGNLCWLREFKGSFWMYFSKKEVVPQHGLEPRT